MPKNIFFAKYKKSQTISAALMVIAIAAIGTYLIISSHAATPYASINANKGLLTSGAMLQTDPAASNGTYVQFGSGSSNNPPSPLGISGNWALKFDDEFTGSSLDTTKWSTGWFGSGLTQGVNGGEQDCYDPGQVSVSGGTLAIAAITKQETCGGQTQPYATGLISTNGKYSFTYGVMEARIWFPGSGSTVADWPDFWADGQNWPTDGEIDVAEGLAGQPCYHFHYTDSANAPGACPNFAGAASGWHTYSADWQPGSITYYYDGVQVGRITSGITSQPMYLILNLALESDISPPNITPATLQVDYVRVWQ